MCNLGVCLQMPTVTYTSPHEYFHVLCCAVLQVGRWEEAVSRFNAMLSPSSPVRPTASTFNTIMTGYMRLGRYDKVTPASAPRLANTTGLPCT